MCVSSIFNFFLILENSLEVQWLIFCASNALGASLTPGLGTMVFPESSVDKESACSAGDSGSVPGSGRSPGEGNSNPLQYSCLGNTMDRKALWATLGSQRVGPLRGLTLWIRWTFQEY